jgi:hypothetical protein
MVRMSAVIEHVVCCRLWTRADAVVSCNAMAQIDQSGPALRSSACKQRANRPATVIDVVDSASAAPDFSLLGGLLHHLGRLLGLVRGSSDTILLGLALAGTTWVVLVLLTLAEGVAAQVFTLGAVGIHVRLLPALALAGSPRGLRNGRRTRHDDRQHPGPHDPAHLGLQRIAAQREYRAGHAALDRFHQAHSVALVLVRSYGTKVQFRLAMAVAIMTRQ